MERKHVLGIISPIISTSCVFIAVLLAPSFDWESDPLSHLGHWFRTDIGPNPILRAFVFNAGLIIGGALISIFFIGLIRDIEHVPSKVVLLGPAITGLFLAGVGVFSENLPLGHIVSALGFFFSIPISAVLVGIIWLMQKEARSYGGFILLLAILEIILFRPWTSIAIWEFVMAMLSSIEAWFIILLDMKGHLDILKSE